MARLIPPLYVDTRSPGEKMIFDAFERDELSKDWVVFHSLDMPKHQTQGEGEIDFVVLIPGMGVMCLEVKASPNIARRGGMWRTMGKSYRDPRGPFKQVKDNTFSLLRRVKSAHKQMSRVPFFGLVVFTACKFRALTRETQQEWDDFDFIDASDLARHPISELIKRAFIEQTKRHKLELGDFNEERFNEMVDILRPDFENMLTPRERLENSEIQARRYTREQFKILDGILLNERIVVDGLAGTGKTILAIEYARRMSKKGIVLFLTPVWKLGQYLANETRLAPPNFVGSFQSFKKLYFDGDKLSARFDGYFDYLVLDEAQDFVESGAFKDFNAALKGGIENGKWIMFGDYYSRRFEHSQLEKFDEFRKKYRPTICTLTENCRNPSGLAKLVEDLVGFGKKYGALMRTESESGLKVDFYDTLRQQTSMLVDILNELLNSGIGASSIAILSAKSEECVLPLANGNIWKNKMSSEIGQNKIVHAKVEDFKGLESDFVILTDLESLDTPEARRTFYLGATRAKAGLYILANKRLEKTFSEAEKNLSE